MDQQAVIEATQKWVERAVVGLNLCPFAKAVVVRKQIRYHVCESDHVAELLQTLANEILFLLEQDEQVTETTLLIHPNVLTDFFDYNDFLDEVDHLIETLELEGIIQVASFHPDYQFADARSDDIENYTNRSPYPCLHILRETSIDRAVESFPEAEEIFERNKARLAALGLEGWEKLFKD